MDKNISVGAVAPPTDPSREQCAASEMSRGPILWVLQADYSNTSSLMFENRPVDSIESLLDAVRKAAEGDATLIRIFPFDGSKGGR